MSIDYVVALAAPPPAARVIAGALARYGNPRGTWRDRIRFGSLVLQRTDDTAMMRMAETRTRRKCRFVATVQIWGSSDAISHAAAVLIDECGGGLLLTDEGVVLDASRGATVELAPIEVTIPDEVRAAFIPGQPRYALANRRGTHYQLGAFFAEAGLDPRTSELELIEAPTNNFEHELRTQGVPKAMALYRVHYKRWFVKSAREADWEAMLAAVCGFARDAGGVIYTIGPPQTTKPPAVALRYDFEPTPQRARRPQAASRTSQPAKPQTTATRTTRRKIAKPNR